MTYQLKLEFYGDSPELCKTLLTRADGTSISSIRGRTPGALRGSGTFHWSGAVQAFAKLLLLTYRTSLAPQPQPAATIAGGAGSLASTLDYAISKQPAWTVDMLGTDAAGHSRIKRFIHRTNPERKRPGPVTIGINEALLPPSAITVFWNDTKISTLKEIDYLIEQLIGSAQEPSSQLHHAGQAAL